VQVLGLSNGLCSPTAGRLRTSTSRGTHTLGISQPLNEGLARHCHGYEDFVATEERVEHMKTLTRTSHDCASEVVASILKGDAQPWP